MIKKSATVHQRTPRSLKRYLAKRSIDSEASWCRADISGIRKRLPDLRQNLERPIWASTSIKAAMEIGRTTAPSAGAVATDVVALNAKRPVTGAVAGSMEGSYNFDWKTAFKEELAFSERVNLNHRHLPMMQANLALRTIEEQLYKIQKAINQMRPDIKAGDWDFSIRDGQIEVTGSMDASDRKWIEKALNGNDELVSAAKSYLSASVIYLETSEDNPVYGGQNRFTGKVVFYDFKNVEKQFGQSFRFKEVMSAAHELYRNTRTGEVGDAGDYFGGDTLEIFASRLNPKFVAEPAARI